MFTVYFMESYYINGMARVEKFEKEKDARAAIEWSNARRILLTGIYGEVITEIKQR